MKGCWWKFDGVVMELLHPCVWHALSHQLPLVCFSMWEDNITGTWLREEKSCFLKNSASFVVFPLTRVLFLLLSVCLFVRLDLRCDKMNKVEWRKMFFFYPSLLSSNLLFHLRMYWCFPYVKYVSQVLFVSSRTPGFFMNTYKSRCKKIHHLGLRWRLNLSTFYYPVRFACHSPIGTCIFFILCVYSITRLLPLLGFCSKSKLCLKV